MKKSKITINGEKLEFSYLSAIINRDGADEKEKNARTEQATKLYYKQYFYWNERSTPKMIIYKIVFRPTEVKAKSSAMRRKADYKSRNCEFVSVQRGWRQHFFKEAVKHFF